jgi:16S rRNA (cytidine1402-2'-O)-methyltransferase
MGTLYLVSTPIGNLEDVTERARRILGEVDIVLAEDTRRTGILLRHLKIRRPLLSLHGHNEEARSREVLDALEGEGSLALVSDAGTPLLSDPGERLVANVLDAGHRVVPIPGPSAVLAALVASGLPALPFTFLGFAPRKGKDRTRFLERIASSVETVVAFESPERTGALLNDLARVCGDGRRGAVARELTKVHEEFQRGTLEELAAYYREKPPRGEVTVVVAPSEGDGVPEEVDREAALALGRSLLEGGTSPSRAAREVAARLGISRNRAYDLIQELSPGS